MKSTERTWPREILQRRHFIRTLIPIALLLGLLLSFDCVAHFVQILLDTSRGDRVDTREIEVLIRFAHPFEQTLMDMAPPEFLSVQAPDGIHDLSASLREERENGRRYYRSRYAYSRPGDHIFLVKPKAYFEAAEAKFIQHFTKLVVNAGGVESGWDQAFGLPVEIIPLTRPYGLWRGNLFSGRVLVGGKPAANTRVEVAYENRRKIEAPSPLHAVQVLKTDANGLFSYAMPFSGWWGYAALTESEARIKREDGNSYAVEIGGLIWVYADAPLPQGE